MTQVSEITIILKGNDSTFKKKFLCYDKIVLDREDFFLQSFIHQTQEEFKGEIDEIKIKISMEM